MPGVIIIGLQWGDEGKGKVVDILSEKADLIVRSNGGDNAGHTIVFEDEEFKLHLLPSGILHPNTECFIGAGCVINPKVLLSEISQLERRGIKVKGRLLVSARAPVIFPHHIALDAQLEKGKGELAIGTTKKGIGPCYTEAAARSCIRLGELAHESHLKKRLAACAHPLLSSSLCEIVEEYAGYGAELSSLLAASDTAVSFALKEGKRVLFEGANGTFLDNIFGSYPFVTSSHTLASGVLWGAGVGPTQVDHTLGVVKAFTTRVGAGPLPTMLSTEERRQFLSAKEARELGTTTGRERRIGWFDAALVREAIALNGVNSLALTKLDVLDNLPVIKICTGYTLRGHPCEALPVLIEEWDALEPIYEEVPGWQSPTVHIKEISDLPKRATAYIERIEELLSTPIALLSLGPKREQTLQLKPIEVL